MNLCGAANSDVQTLSRLVIYLGVSVSTIAPYIPEGQESNPDLIIFKFLGNCN